MKITFIQTGGTIDKDYPRKTKGYAFEIADPAVERILEKGNPNFAFEIISLFRKDSLEITDEDRERICEVCSEAETDKIVITHGTDTMLETARALSNVAGKTVVLTGALLPERFSGSDAPFNLGVAIGAINVLQPGVYIAMNGRVYPWDQCVRDTKNGWFVENHA